MYIKESIWGSGNVRVSALKKKHSLFSSLLLSARFGSGSPFFLSMLKPLLKSLGLVGLLLASACRPGRDLVYFSDLKQTVTYLAPADNTNEPRIQPNDLLSISLSSLNQESNVLFNSGVLMPAGSGSAAGGVMKINDGYLVDKNGEINFPVMGKVALGGLTKKEATERMTVQFTKYVKNPIVNILFLNFKVTVIGEVNHPSTFTVPSERINILEALGLAGDMTAFGRRDNLLILRDKNGARSTIRINLNNKEVLNSPYFYLQQNDILYVEPHNRSKVAQTSAGNRYIPIAVAAITAVAIFLANARR